MAFGEMLTGRSTSLLQSVDAAMADSISNLIIDTNHRPAGSLGTPPADVVRERPTKVKLLGYTHGRLVAVSLISTRQQHSADLASPSLPPRAKADHHHDDPGMLAS